MLSLDGCQGASLSTVHRSILLQIAFTENEIENSLTANIRLLKIMNWHLCDISEQIVDTGPIFH